MSSSSSSSPNPTTKKSHPRVAVGTKLHNTNRKPEPGSTTTTTTTPASISSSRASRGTTTAAASATTHYEHVADDSRPLCRFFALQGNCRYGEDCTFSHSLPAGCQDMVQAAKMKIPCRFFLAGNCRYGEHCALRHERMPSSFADMKGTNTTAPDAQQSQQQSPQYTCGICLDAVGSEYNKRFGLLEGCDHVYCMECIMNWRTEGSGQAADRRVCPACRQKSLFIIPSWNYSVGDEKKEVMNRYKARLAKLPCKRFDGTTLNSCPFGRDCFYAHTDRQTGANVKPREKTMEQMAQERREESNRRRRSRAREVEDDLELLRLFMLLGRLSTSHGRRVVDENDTDWDDDWDDEEDDPFDRAFYGGMF